MKGKKLCVGLFLSCLLGTAIPVSIGIKVLSDRLVLAPLSESSAKPQSKLKPVYPAVLTGRPSTELGDFILSAMPDKGNVNNAGWSWNWQSESERIAWSPELDASSDDTSRVGVMRIHVLGDTANVLRETNQELGWDVALATPTNPTLGPQKIAFSPQECFGFLNDGCTFDTLPSLVHAGINAHAQCIHHTFQGENATYLIHHEDKEDRLLSWEVVGGSGGYSQRWWLEKPSAEAVQADCGDTYNAPSPEELVMHARNRPDIERYKAAAENALKDIASRVPESKGKRCVMRLVMEKGLIMPRVIDVSRVGNMAPLCDEAVNALSTAAWPDSVSHSITVVDINIEG